MTTLWVVLCFYGTLMWLVAPATSAIQAFFAGRDARGREPGTLLITTSVVVSWIFSKSITNSADLGRDFGLLGGLAYAIYYAGIPICGLLIIRLRKRMGAISLADYLTRAYGGAAAKFFLLIVLLRLYNEIWSNTAVVGSYFGPLGSRRFVLSALVFTAFVLIYTLKGGMRTSLVTDVLQFGLLAITVTAALLWVLPRAAGLSIAPARPGIWDSGIDLILVALLQCVAYPFHDPILTDRAFLADEATTRRSYLLAGGISATIILLFSTIGMAARTLGGPAQAEAPVQAAAAAGAGMLALMMAVMMISGGSAVDSTLSSTSKSIVLDWKLGTRPVLWGRSAMVGIALVGNIPLLFGAPILKATTVSGTMVLGLAPIFLFPTQQRRSALAFFAPVGASVVLGILSALWPRLLPFTIGSGPNGALLAWNVVITLLSWGLFGLFFLSRP